MKKKISVVIPTYNEEGNVKPLAESIVAVMETELPEYRYEILFIDNHSKDRTRMYLRGLCDSDVRGLPGSGRYDRKVRKRVGERIQNCHWHQKSEQRKPDDVLDPWMLL